MASTDHTETMRFRYAERADGFLLPQLALVYPLSSVARDNYDKETDSYLAEVKFPPSFKEPELWHPIFHQTAGNACHQHSIMARPLEATIEGHKLTKLLENKYAGSCMGMWGLPLNEVISYREILQAEGLDCNETYSVLQEGIYPIDLTEEAVRLLVAEDIPTDYEGMQALFDDKEDGQFSFLFAGSPMHLQLWVLGTNCD